MSPRKHFRTVDGIRKATINKVRQLLQARNRQARFAEMMWTGRFEHHTDSKK